jgi:hypothetical protein
MEKKIFFMIVFLLVPFFAISQEKAQKKQVTIEEKLQKYEGTFQIQVNNPRLKPAIPYNIDELIETNRSQNEVKYLQLGTQVRLMILPKNQAKGKSKLPMISTY